MGEIIEITKDQIDKDEVSLPDGYKIVTYKTKENIDAEKQAEIDFLASQLGEEPSDIELIELGKMGHPYYMDLTRIEILREELK